MSKVLSSDPKFFFIHSVEPDFYSKDLSDSCFLNPVHSKYHIILIIFSGNGKLKYDLSELEISKPSVYFFSPYQIIHIDRNENLLGKVIYFSIDFYCIESNKFEISCNGPLFNNSLYHSNIILEENQIQIFQNLYSEIILELNTRSPDRDILLSYLKLILLKSLRMKNESIENFSYSIEDRKFIYKFQIELENHFKFNHKISHYSHLMNVNNYTLDSKLKKLLGKSFSRILKERIILEAKRYLIGNNLRILDIAHELGYDDPFYFSRFFKKMTGVSPETFRNVYFSKKSI